MTIAETRQKILDSDEFVLTEFRKLQYLYGLKQEIRFNDTRSSDGMGESVAEHIYGMMVATQYFLPLEDVDICWDQVKIFQMITWHDIEEIEVGDMIAYQKTAERKELEAKAEAVAVSKIPESMQPEVKKVLTEYNARQSAEARFTKAVDKIDVLLQMYTSIGKKVCVREQSTLKQHNSVKDPYMKDWPYIYRFKTVITDKLIEDGFLQT